MPGSNTITSRRRPLSTCATSTLTVAHGLYKRAVELNGPIGSMTRWLATMTSPIANMVQYQCLKILTFADDHILSIENKVEAHFPPSRHVFDSIDNMVHKVEDFPRNLGNSIKKFPAMLHKIPLLDWGVIYALKWLEFITSVLVIWSLDCAKEKEIRVDTNCKEQNNQIPRESGSTIKCSYREALEKGLKNGNVENYSQGCGRDYDEKDAWNWNEETDDSQMGDIISTNEDPLLELFEFGWQAPKPKTTPSTSRSNSYIT